MRFDILAYLKNKTEIEITEMASLYSRLSTLSL